MAIAKELALAQEQIDAILTTEWNMRIATLGPGTRINVTPMWFGWAGGKIYTFGRGQKVINLRKNSSCTVLVDRNEKFPELQGIMILGQGHVLEDATAEEADSSLQSTRYGAELELEHPGEDRDRYGCEVDCEHDYLRYG